MLKLIEYTNEQNKYAKIFSYKYTIKHNSAVSSSS